MVVNIQDDILKLHAMGLLSRLLQDKATGGNILWATDAYSRFGDWYTPGNEIRPQRITGENSDLIKTRARRAMEQRTERTRQHAEVFTPLWIVKKMNDVADEQWFGRKDGFNTLTDEGKVAFTNKQKHWKLYVDARRLEITCGEAPFLVTRYDVETGEALPVEERIGFLDRKLRVVSENAADIEEWKTWALRAVQSIYGYELQGDNLLIARVNILCSVEEHMMSRWRQRPDKAWLEKLCNVICWNLWQMDGLSGCVPVPPRPTEEQLCLFPPEPQFEQENLFGEKEDNEIGCRLYDWRNGGQGRSISYQALREKGPVLMKFDFVIGNPPYQEETESDSTRMPPIYNHFMEQSYCIAPVVELITPARFLFNAGYTPKAWNEKMLNDEHLKVVFYEQNSEKVFSNTDIMGGIVVTLHNSSKEFGAIGTFTVFDELNTVLSKVKAKHDISLATIVVPALSYKLSELMKKENPNSLDRLRTSCFTTLQEIFFEKSPVDGNAYFQMIGIIGNKREWRYVRRDYIVDSFGKTDKYKVILPASNGSGAIGEVTPTPLIGQPLIGKPSVGYTQSFISVGCFDAENEAQACYKYVCSKFARALLGVLKITQHNPPDKWRFVPLQNFTPASDIDWSKSIPEIDQQLYAKYGLDAAEIEFIESHVKEMS